ncbi:MAG: glycerate kinase [Intrasporangium sp.]|uniref:glycerate kinase family protein n=1 Tax=Intrasporangium sp. TaxID=1925024 RepID=UPI002649550D|nr:glycerate kinase [Intrasporangium sp.]MDN5796596.1 glycerate kinase [Intrasporangium sp.]
MHVLIVPDRFDALPSPRVAAMLADGWRRTAPHDMLACLPASDGGAGFVGALASGIEGPFEAVVTTDPLGRPVPATILLVPGETGPTAYVEAAQAAGVHLLAADERDPTRTTSAGVGHLLLAALDLGARRIVVGVGGLGTNDAGAGLLAALGVGSPDGLARGGGTLAGLGPDQVGGLDAARERFRTVELVIAADVASPLLGLKGASAVFAGRIGATPAQAQGLEGALGHFAGLLARAYPPRPDLLSGEAIRPERALGAGAGGGVGYALHLLGGRYVAGVEAVLDAVGFDRFAAASDLVVTGCGAFDWESLQGSVPLGVSRRADQFGVPTLLVAGQSVVSRRETMEAGLNGVYTLAGAEAHAQVAVGDGTESRLADLAARVARTWSPTQS